MAEKDIGNKFFYARVSSKGQNLERQLEDASQWLFKKKYDELNAQELNEFNYRVVQEKVSGKNTADRPKFLELKERLRRHDVLAVSELDRLGRNMQEIEAFINELQLKQVALVVLDFPLLSSTNEANSEHFLIQGIILKVLLYSAEKEREKIRARQLSGIKIAKENNVYVGKKAKYSKDSKGTDLLVYNTICTELEKNTAISKIAKMVDVTRPTVYRIKKELELEKDQD